MRLHTTFATCLTLAACTQAASAQAPLYDLRGQAGDRFCQSATGIADLNGDGVRDFLVGAPFSSSGGPNFGAVRLISGATGQVFWNLYGEAAGDAFGYSVAAIGDTDGDGIEDFAVGAPYHDFAGSPDAGAAYAFSGATWQQLGKVVTGGDNARLGWSVTGFEGDLGGDGVPDWAAGSPGSFNSAGALRYVSGATQMINFTVVGQQPGGLLGWSIDAAGDSNGNGVPELIVGAPTETHAGFQTCGAAYLFEFGAKLMTRVGTGTSNQMGTSVAGLGDANGDGFPDFVLGEASSNVGAFDGGRVDVVSGAPAHTTLWSVTGEAYSQLGYAVAAAGDVNGDGFADVLAGAPFSDLGGPDHGRADLFSGVDGTTLLTFGGYAPDDELGRTVAGLGDLNNDGYDDLLAGSPQSDYPGSNSGWAHLALGSQASPVAYCTSKTNSAGCSPTITYVGCPSASISNYFHILGYQVLPNVAGLMVWSQGQAAIPFFGGTLCLAPPIKRSALQFSQDQDGTACGGLFDQSFNHDPMNEFGLTGGSTLYAQFWYRDPGFSAPNNVGLTRGLAIEIFP